jgi:hypothetical protein
MSLKHQMYPNLILAFLIQYTILKLTNEKLTKLLRKTQINFMKGFKGSDENVDQNILTLFCQFFIRPDLPSKS